MHGTEHGMAKSEEGRGSTESRNLPLKMDQGHEEAHAGGRLSAGKV